MKEIEVKILEINEKKVEETLKSLGAKKVFDGHIQTVFFDFKNHRIKRLKDVLRLRKQRDKTELTFKRVSITPTAKSAEEYSVGVSDLEAMAKILENIGLVITESMQKHRVSYKLDSTLFDIDRYFDKYKFIPEFLEIEAENTDIIYKYAEILGYKAEECLPWSTDDLIKHYSKLEKNTEI